MCIYYYYYYLFVCFALHSAAVNTPALPLCRSPARIDTSAALINPLCYHQLLSHEAAEGENNCHCCNSVPLILSIRTKPPRPAIMPLRPPPKTAAKAATCSRVEMKEIGMTRARIANAEALVKHISERIRTDNKSVLGRTGLPTGVTRSCRETPSSGASPDLRHSRASHSPSDKRLSPHSNAGFQHPAKPIISFGGPDPGEAGVVDPYPNESYEVVSAYLQQLVRDLMGQMTGASSAQHYDRHVLLVDELLRREAIFGFTPSMILTGVGDIMGLLAEALLAGKFLLPPHPTHGCSKSQAHRAAIAAAAAASAGMSPSATTDHPLDRTDLAVPTLGIETYLPAHIKKSVNPGYHGPDGVLSDPPDLSAAASAEPAAADGEGSGAEHLSPQARQRAYETKILTVQDALYAMIQHCARPLVCITMDDQRHIAAAVEHLCGVLSRIASEVVSDPPPEMPPSPSLMDSFPVLPKAATDYPLSSTGEEQPEYSIGAAGVMMPSTGANASTSDVLPEMNHGVHLGGLSVEEHESMTRAIRLAALHAIEAILSVYDRHIDTIELNKEKERPAAVGSSANAKGGQKRKGTTDRTHTDTVTTAILNSLDLNRSETSHVLVERWASILSHVPPIDCDEEGCAGQAPLLDSARNVNPFTAKDAYDCDAPDSDEEKDEEGGAKTACSVPLGELVSPEGTNTEEYSFKGSGVGAGNSSLRPERRRESTTKRFAMDDSRFRGVLTAAEEEEIAAILHIYIQLFSLSEYAMKGVHSHISIKNPVPDTNFDVPLHPQVPILVARTLARCAVGDYCASLCMDLLWQLIIGAPRMTSRSILYDIPTVPDNVEPTNTLFETSATENLFQALVNFLNTSHRALQREMRNDVVIMLTAILRQNINAMDNVPLDCFMPRTELQYPIPLSTIDAFSAISLVLFDLLCRPELSVDATINSRISMEDRESFQGTNNPCLSFVSKQTLLQSSIRFHGVSCATLRKDNLQLKRIGWQFLEAFCEWQAVHMSYEGKVLDLMRQEKQRLESLEPLGNSKSKPAAYPDNAMYAMGPGQTSKEHVRGETGDCQSEELLQQRRETYESFNLVDLCHLGFLDVLLMYCSVQCQNSVVLEWTKEELYALQEESWVLLGAMVRSAEDNRERYGLTSMRQEDIDEVRSRLVSATPSTANSIRNEEGMAKKEEPADEASAQPQSHDEQSQYYAADLYFIALDGVGVALTFITCAPAVVDRLKFLAVSLLASVSRSSDRAVQRSLAYASPVLVPVLTELLQSLLVEVKSGCGTGYRTTEKWNDNGVRVVEQVPCSTIPPCDKLKNLVLACFSLLMNTGAAANQLMQAAGPTKTHPDLKLHECYSPDSGPQLVLSRSSASTSSEMRALSPEVPSAAWHFLRCGGIHQLVAWVEYVLEPNPARKTAASIAALAKNAATREKTRPPIVEQDLYGDLDLLLVILSCIRTLVLGVPPSECALMDENGVAALLSIIETLAIAADALPKDRTENVDCIIRDRSISLSLPSGFHNRTVESMRRDEFNDALRYALVVLSDLFLSCKAASQYFFAWHCNYLPKAHEVGFGVPNHLNPHDNYLNATQLLLAVWTKATGMRSPDDPFYFDPESPDNERNLTIGMQVLNCNLRALTLVSLRREYARRLLRRRVAERMKDVQERGSSSSFISVPELVNYYYYIFGSQVTNLSDEEIALHMQVLINTEDESVHSIHGRLITDGICQPLGLAVKVFSCLAAIGFDNLVDVPISPAERAHLIGAAALPALCTDELCVSMAEVARINENLPWGEATDVGTSRSFIQVKSLNMDDVVAMRPTTPDRRCLSTIMDDVQSRSHELSQLFDLGTNSEKTQVRELYNRFLITRLKQPVGVASLWEEYNDRQGTCTTCAFERVDVAAMEQFEASNNANIMSPALTSEGSGVMSPTHSGSPNSRTTPAKLASYVSRKVERDQEEDTLKAVQRSYPGDAYQPSQGEKSMRVMSPVNEEGEQQEIPLTSTPSTMAHNMAVYNHQGGEFLAPVAGAPRCSHQGPCNCGNYGANPLNALKSPPTVPGAAPKLQPDNFISLVNPMGTDNGTFQVPTLDHTRSSGVDLQVTWPSRPKSSLAEKHLKKDRMIKNSLRAVGGVTVSRQKPSVAKPTLQFTEDFERNARIEAQDLVDRVFAHVEYAEPQPAYVFSLEPEEEDGTKSASDSMLATGPNCLMELWKWAEIVPSPLLPVPSSWLVSGGGRGMEYVTNTEKKKKKLPSIDAALGWPFPSLALLHGRCHPMSKIEYRFPFSSFVIHILTNDSSSPHWMRACGRLFVGLLHRDSRYTALQLAPVYAAKRWLLHMSKPLFSDGDANTDYIIAPDPQLLQPCPGALKGVLEARLTAARRYYTDGPWSSSSGPTGAVPPPFPASQIRNVSVVAHVDHGKTTLTDAILRWAELLPKDAAVGTFTDRLQVEKQRGITIKAQTCSVMVRKVTPGTESGAPVVENSFLINLVDTPGHADFQYEVSRSLHATEGVLLLVDAGQGVEAQTMAQFHAVLEREGEIVPVLTKMDTVVSDQRVKKTLSEMEDSMSVLEEEVLFTSAKQKRGLEAVFQAIIDRVPPPAGRVGYSDFVQLPVLHPDSAQRKAAEAAIVPLRALIVDCFTAESSGMNNTAVGEQEGSSELRRDGVYCLVRVMDGTVTRGTSVVLYHSGCRTKVEEVGFLHPNLQALPALSAGMVGYVFAKAIQKEDVRVGDTLCTLPTPRFVLSSKKESAGKGGEAVPATSPAFVLHPIPGFRCTHPVVFAGIFPDDDNMITTLRETVAMLCLNDPSVTVQELKCQALGTGLQLGFLGLLHLQVFIDRMLQEFGMPVLVTPPQVQYMYVGPNEDPSDSTKHKPLTVENWLWPHEGVGAYLEPVVHATVVTPREYFDPINQAAMTRFRGEQEDMRGMDDGRLIVRYRMPLGDLARGFFATVKSASHGYAHLDYDHPHYVEAAVVKVDIVINKSKISALSFIAPQHEALDKARQVLRSLKENLQRSVVDLPIQALIGTKIVGRETIKAYRKDVTAKIHAGDISRKQKKWNDQKKGKKRIARRTVGTVTLDQEVLSAAMGATMHGA
eukprot:gene11960-8233_t